MACAGVKAKTRVHARLDAQTRVCLVSNRIYKEGFLSQDCKLTWYHWLLGCVPISNGGHCSLGCSCRAGIGSEGSVPGTHGAAGHVV